MVKAEKNDGSLEEFFVQDGTIEFYNDVLVLLSSSVLNKKHFSKENLDNLIQKTEKALSKNDITDEERYILNHQLESIKEIRI